MQSNDTVILFLALLAILCQIFVITTISVGAITLFNASVRTSFRSAVAALQPIAASFAFAVALVTMLGSLYMSQVKHFIPCHLCWIQRSLLYPQVLWTLLLWIKPKWSVIRVIAILMLTGDIGVSTYHYLLEWYPTLETSVCSLKNPCSLVWYREFHYITTALMALTSACTVLILLIVSSQGIFKPKRFVLGGLVVSIVVFLSFMFVL